jgi:hypothetical protein
MDTEQDPQTLDEEETYGVARDEFSVDPKAMDPEFKQELKQLVYVDLPTDVDYAARMDEERAVMFTNDGVRGELLTREKATGYSFPPLERTICVSIGESYALAEEFAQPLDIARLAAENEALDEQVFTQRLKKITKVIQVDNVIRELVSRIRMELYMYPREHERIRAWIERAKALRETLPAAATPDEEAQTPQAHFEANQLLGVPLPPEKGASRPVMEHVWELGKEDDTFNPRSKKGVEQLTQISSPVKRCLWIANLKNGAPFWNRFPSVTCNVYDVCHHDGHLVTVCTSDQKILVAWHKTLGSRLKAKGTLVTNHTRTIFDKKRALGHVRQVRAFEGHYAVVVFDRHVVVVSPHAATLVYRYSSYVSSAAWIGGRAIVGTRDGYIVDDAQIIDMPYRLPILFLEHQGGGIVLAGTRSSIYRFHVSSEIGPYQLNVPCPMGVSGCGALIGSVSLTGKIWITNTYAKQQLSRDINPPPAIAEHVDLLKDAKRTKDDPDNPSTFWRLKYPFQYQYRAFWMGRLQLNILYPDMTIRTLYFKVTKNE